MLPNQHKSLSNLLSKHDQVQRVWAHTSAEENPSCQVLRKCGLKIIAEMNDPEDGQLWRWEILR